MKKIAIFPGSFDPFTLGHKIIVDQGLQLFDKIVVAIGVNTVKSGLLSPEKRVEMIREIYCDNPNVEVMTYKGLTVDFCKTVGAEYMLRGMRNTVDFEFERNMMQINQSLSPDVITVLLFTPPKYVAISSSVVREIIAFGGDVSQFLPEGVDIKKFL